MNMLQTITPTISSVELVEIINGLREEGAAELLHKNFLAKIENHPGIQSAKFSADYKDSRGRLQKCYNLPKREAELLIMSLREAWPDCVVNQQIDNWKSKAPSQGLFVALA